MNDNGYFKAGVTTTKDVYLRLSYLASKYGVPVDLKQLLGGRFIHGRQDSSDTKGQ